MSFSQPVSPRQLRPSPAEQDDSTAALNTTGAAVPEGDESAEKAAPAEKKSSRSKRGSRREERESVLTSFQRFLDTLSIRLLCEVFLRQVRRLFVVGVVVYADVHVRTDHGQELFGHYHHVAELRRERDRQDAQRRPLQRIGILTQEYLEAILQATGLQDDLTTSELADCISISPTNSKLVTKEDDYYNQLVLSHRPQTAVVALGQDHGAGSPRPDMPGLSQALYGRLPHQCGLAGHQL